MNSEQYLIPEILRSFQRSYRRFNVCTLTFPELFTLISNEQQKILLKACSIDSYMIIELDRPVKKLELVNPYKYSSYAKKFVRISPMLWKKFNALTIQMRRETGKNIRIVSGYRAPAYQSVLFLKELYLHNFDLNITKSVIKLPGKSEHQNYEDMAIDLGNIRHRLLEDDVIYQWLEENANSFGFYNSYPKKTLPSKMQFEPWHWNFKVIQ